MNKFKSLVVLMIVLIVGAASVSAQATPESTPDASTTQAAQSPVVITLERTACFGRCPVYTVSILADGTVLYNGGQFVDVTGEQQGAIDPAVVTQMVAALDKVGYFGWNEDYSRMDVTDLSYITTSAIKDGVTHTIRHYLGDFSAPAQLAFVEQWIDLMAGTAAWTGVQNDASAFSVNGNSPVATLSVSRASALARFTASPSMPMARSSTPAWRMWITSASRPTMSIRRKSTRLPCRRRRSVSSAGRPFTTRWS